MGPHRYSQEGRTISAIPYQSPRLVGIPGIDSPLVRGYYPAPSAAFREGDILKVTTVGTILTPAPTGSGNFSANLGPAASAVTFGSASTSGAPAQAYYIVVTYTATSKESQPSQEFVVYAAAGTTPTVTVAAAGAPSGTTNFATYVSVYPGGEALQDTTRTTTATDSAFTIPWPFTNSKGVNRAASNVNSSIVGLALHDSAALFQSGIGGAGTSGGPANVLGTWSNPPPLGAPDPLQDLAASLVAPAIIEISLKQPYYTSLNGTTAGFTLDTAQQAAGIFIADTTATTAITILGAIGGAQSDVGGGPGDTGTRIRASVSTGAI